MKATIFWFSAAALLAVTAPVHALQNNCGPREAVVERLATVYGETRQSVGISDHNLLIEVYASSETGTWTIVTTSPRGVSCLLTSGFAFESLAESLPPRGEPL